MTNPDHIRAALADRAAAAWDAAQPDPRAPDPAAKRPRKRKPATHGGKRRGSGRKPAGTVLIRASPKKETAAKMKTLARTRRLTLGQLLDHTFLATASCDDSGDGSNRAG